MGRSTATAKTTISSGSFDSDAYFRIIGNVHTPVVVWDTQNRIKLVNEATHSLVASFRGLHPGMTTPGVGDKCPWLARELERFIESNQDEQTVTKELPVDADTVYLELKFVRLTDMRGRYCGNSVSIRDISDLARKEMEQALRESEERYRRLVELSPDPIGVHCQGKFVYANPAMVKLLGADNEQQLLGHSVLDFMHPDYRELVKERMRVALEGEVGPITEEKVITLDDRVIDVEVLASPFKYQGMPAVQVVGHDITERKKLEEEHLKNTKLESLGILAGGLAHDFNNILTIILGNISMARAAVQPGEKIYTKLAEIEKAAFEAIGLTQQLLTFAKGGQPVKRTISIGDLILEATTFALRGSNVRFNHQIAEDLWAVEVDEGQIKQVINNLMINAQQAMRQGGIVWVGAENVRINKTTKVQPVQAKREYVKITVRDQGTGIKAETLPKIFDPYFTTKPDGNGLGLATVYSIIKKHHGYITVESKEGIGTTFYIYLPRSDAKVLAKKHRPKILKGKGRVLIVDDEEKIRQVIGEMLEYLGYDFATAADGLEGMEIYRQGYTSGQSFAAVIMDLTIPGGLGGKEAIKQFLQFDPQVKVIVSSGYSDDPVMADYKKYGFAGCVKKPYRIEELSKVLKQVTKAHGNES